MPSSWSSGLFRRRRLRDQRLDSEWPAWPAACHSAAETANPLITEIALKLFTYCVACEAIRSITRQSVVNVVDVVVVLSEFKIKKSVHRALITIEAIIVGLIWGYLG